MAASATKTAPTVRHEEFCTPREGAAEPRLERYVHLGDDPSTNRSRPTHDVTRCLECGAMSYQPRN